MKTGTRALMLSTLVIVLAAVLAWLLKDGAVFTTATTTSIVGKFGYDAVRDYPAKSGSENAQWESTSS